MSTIMIFSFKINHNVPVLRKFHWKKTFYKLSCAISILADFNL